MNIFDDFQRQYRLWQELMNSPIQRLMKEMKRSHLQSLIEQTRHAQEFKKYYFNSSAINALSNLRIDYENWRANIKNLATPQFQEQLRLVIDQINLPALHSIASEWQRVLNDSDALQKFSQSFGGQIIERLYYITNTDDSDYAELQVQSLEELLVNQVSQIPKSKLSNEAIIQILLSIILFVFSYFSSMQTEDRIKSRIDKVEEVVLEKLQKIEDRLLEKIEDIQPSDDTENIFVAIEKVNVRIKPSTSSKIVYVLSPNMKVEVIGKNGDWVNVQFFDYIEGALKEGWVHKDFLMSTDNK